MRIRMGGSRLRGNVHLHIIVVKRSDAARHRQVLALLVVVPLRCFSLPLSSVGMRVLLVAEEGRAGDGAQGAGERAVGAAVAQLVLPAVGPMLSLLLLLLLLKVVGHGS